MQVRVVFPEQLLHPRDALCAGAGRGARGGRALLLSIPDGGFSILGVSLDIMSSGPFHVSVLKELS